MNKADTGSMANEQLLELYGYYKQATVGDVNVSKPGLMSMDLKGRAKWDAWNSHKGMSTADAQAKYVEVVKQYLPADVVAQL